MTLQAKIIAGLVAVILALGGAYWSSLARIHTLNEKVSNAERLAGERLNDVEQCRATMADLVDENERMANAVREQNARLQALTEAARTADEEAAKRAAEIEREAAARRRAARARRARTDNPPAAEMQGALAAALGATQ